MRLITALALFFAVATTQASDCPVFPDVYQCENEDNPFVFEREAKDDYFVYTMTYNPGEDYSSEAYRVIADDKLHRNGQVQYRANCHDNSLFVHFVSIAEIDYEKYYIDEDGNLRFFRYSKYMGQEYISEKTGVRKTL